MEWAPGAQTRWTGALRDKKYTIVFPIRCLVSVSWGSLKPLGPLWGPSEALRAKTRWPVSYKKKVELFLASVLLDICMCYVLCVICYVFCVLCCVCVFFFCVMCVFYVMYVLCVFCYLCFMRCVCCVIYLCFMCCVCCVLFMFYVLCLCFI